MKNGLIIGVDGGGTHSRLIAVRTDGTVVAAGTGGGVNYNAISMKIARERLYDAVCALLTQAQETEYEAISLGMSALDGPADEQLINAFAADRFDPERLEMDSDVYMALIGATMGAPGVMVVSGTGAMIVVLDHEGRIHSSAGWGYRLGDPGSAYGVAIQGIQAVMAVWEGNGTPTAMTDSALNFFHADGKRELLEKIYAPDCEPSRIAQFAREVLSQALRGDATAKHVVDKNVEYLAVQTARMLQHCPEKKVVNLYGGMFEHNEWIRKAFYNRMTELVPGASVAMLKYPPELGAVVSRLKRTGRLSESVIRRLKETWEVVAHGGHGSL